MGHFIGIQEKQYFVDDQGRYWIGKQEYDPKTLLPKRVEPTKEVIGGGPK